MGLFSRQPKESFEEIQNRINNSEASEAFLNEFINHLNIGSDWCNFLLGNSKKRSVFLKVEKRGIVVEFLDFSNRNNYTVDKQSYGFGVSGFADLPNLNYVIALKEYLVYGLEKNCPYLEVRLSNPDIIIKIKETAKASW
ncbi:MAG: hypothetical protein IKK37_00885 [Clostridia bacterium]|nr:hypothetical protein [Clostridia bacterium]